MRKECFYATKIVENSAVHDIIIRNISKEVMAVHFIGKLDKNIYKCVTDDIVTDEVVITAKQIEHIQERHLNAIDKYEQYLEEIVREPDYIIESPKPNKAIVLKEIITDDYKRFKTIVRLITSTDDPAYKNSIITFMRISEKDWNRILRNKNILYKRN